MDCTRDRLSQKKEIIKFIKSLGIEVNTTTKALGHQGFFRRNRIDISRNIPETRVIPTLLHEFAHFIVFEKKNICKDFIPIFMENSDIFEEELSKVTNFVDNNSTFEKMKLQKENIKESIKTYEQIVRNKYPNFKRNEKFKPFLNYARFSDAKHLLKYDAIKVLHWFSYKTYSIMNIEQEFPDMPKEFVSYLKLKSCQRKQASISRKINKMTKYYKEPTELFARFVEGLYIDKEEVISLAPYTYNKFKELFLQGYYYPLNKLFEIVNIIL